LARADNGLGEVEQIALDEQVRSALSTVDAEAQDRQLDIRTSLHPVTVTGDRVLLDVLLSNVFRNAVRHNVHGGVLRVELAGDRLVVENDGARYDDARVPELIEPFRRGDSDRVTGSGSGLGLAMVAAVARAHRASLDLTSRPAGGLRLCLTFAGDDTRPQSG
jgi:two-component system sensor histidine kinase VanS